ncbi:MAG: ABC transporter substrate-binding protein [Cellulosilyticaceae bacterium]
MKRFARSLKTLAILGMSLTLLSGCSSGTNQAEAAPQITPPTGSEAPSEKSYTPIEGGVVRTVVKSEPDNLDPYLSAASDTETIMNNVFEGLMGFTPEGEIIPRLATHVDISEDGLNYTFVIRTDVKFHNGNPLTIDDVIYSYNKLAGLNGEKPLSSKFAKVSAITKVDEQTVTFTLSERSASFLAACTEPVLPAGYENQSTTPIGTGPFVFKEYVPGQKIVLDANNDYYDTDRNPRIDTVEFRIMTDQNSILMALKSGDLDLAEIDYTNVLTLGDDYTIYSTPQNMVQLVALNNEVAPFDNIKVRQAINYAIDKDLLVNGVANGFGTKLYTTASPVMGMWYNDLSSADPYPYNPEKAKELLAEAGYANGLTTTIKVPSNYQFHIDTAQVIADQLAQVGITLNIELIEWGQWLENVYTNADYETTIVGLTGKLDPHETFMRFESDYAKNFYNYTNPAYDELIAKANVETNDNKRAELYKEAQQIIANDAVAVFVMDPHQVRVARKDLVGYTAYPVSYFDATTLFYVAP